MYVLPTAADGAHGKSRQKTLVRTDKQGLFGIFAVELIEQIRIVDGGFDSVTVLVQIQFVERVVNQLLFRIAGDIVHEKGDIESVN